MKKMRIAIIGCGGIGTYHFKNLQKIDIAELVGFVDVIPERADALAAEHGSGKAYYNYLDMLNDANPDAVFIGIPPYCHGEIEYELIKRKIPFFVEKPLALDMDLAKDIEKKVKEANLVTAVGFQCRYTNITAETKKFCEENKIAHISCARMGGIPGTPWWKDKSLSGGQIVEQTIHQFDLIRYIYGEPEEVFTYGCNGITSDLPENFKTDELTSTLVKFKSGIIGTITTGCYVKGAEAFYSTLTFSSEKSRAELNIVSNVKLFGVVRENQTEGQGNYIKGDGSFGASSAECTVIKNDGDFGVCCDRTFIEAARDGKPEAVRSPYSDGLKSLAFTIACNKSIECGMPVKVDDLLK